jgi:hypothetical protein
MARIQLRENTPEVQQYLDLTLMLISAATGVAAMGEPDPEEMGMLRQIQVANVALQAALAMVMQARLPPALAPAATPTAASAPPPPPRR